MKFLFGMTAAQRPVALARARDADAEPAGNSAGRVPEKTAAARCSSTDRASEAGGELQLGDDDDGPTRGPSRGNSIRLRKGAKSARFRCRRCCIGTKSICSFEKEFHSNTVPTLHRHPP